ncbi:MAG: hypothetical protein IIA60_08065 [Candidatus Marinimicrobia bacterium]|nr:hypothetical protein [Candidatus Neomarinimicrobiota bacterium]
MKSLRLLILALSITGIGLVSCMRKGTAVQSALPLLEFPQQGLDDPAAYRGYTTRFFRDSGGNTVQVAIDGQSGRVVNIWADAANESISFTVRDTQGQPAAMRWDSPGAELSSQGPARYVRYTLSSEAAGLDLGLFLLGSMRQERDYVYHKGNLEPFGELYSEQAFRELVDNLEALLPGEQNRLLELLHAENLAELRARLLPQVTYHQTDSSAHLLVEQPTFDGLYHLSLDLSVDRSQATIEVSNGVVAIRPLKAGPIRLTVKIGTDSPSLTPLRRDEIFNQDFLNFHQRMKAEHESLSPEAPSGSTAEERRMSFQWLERQMRGVELLVSQDKIMAGLPNFATYFGRDMLLSMLMLEPIWSPYMLEYVIATALNKLSPLGQVSHEEALGTQAIRENATEFNYLITEVLQRKSLGDQPGADSLLDEAASILPTIQVVRETYNMVDEDFQLAVVVARYLASPAISSEEKRAFLLAQSDDGSQTSRLSLLMRNLAYIMQLMQPYVERPEAGNLIEFPRIDEQRWFPGSWRDSGAGYANGRFAMDINVIWAPKALESVGRIFTALSEIGFSISELESLAPDMANPVLRNYALDAEAVPAALKVWQGATKHFSVSLSAPEVKRRIKARLSRLPAGERAHWQRVLSNSGADEHGIEFPALSLDHEGRPIPVVHTDPAALWFLIDYTDDILAGRIDPAELIRRLEIFLLPYPVGLFVEGVGPLVSNDAYATEGVWEHFQRDPYHSPRVVWGREVNLILLGLTKQISGALDADGQVKDPRLDAYVRQLQAALAKILTAVESSGLKHNELWSYRIGDDSLAPTRYATSSDIQLWNLTDLAVQYALARIPKP